MAYHWLSKEDRAQRNAKIVSLWNSDKDLGLTTLGKRFSMSGQQAGNIIREALAKGLTDRKIEPVPYGADCKDEA